MAKLKLAPNVPVRLAVKYCDVVDSQYGLEFRFKGSTPDDRDAVLYARYAEGVDGLVACGALAGEPALPEVLPGKGVSVTLAAKELIVTKEQAAGEQHGRLVFARAGAGAANPVGRPGRVADAVAPEPRAARQITREAPARPPLLGVYLECLDAVLEKVVPRLQRAERLQSDVTAGDAVAAANALFARRCQEER